MKQTQSPLSQDEPVEFRDLTLEELEEVAGGPEVLNDGPPN